MSDRYLSAVLEEAEQIATQHEQVAHSAENSAHEYLRYAILKLLEEGPSVPNITLPWLDDVTVGYGLDAAMFESWNTDVEWWTTVPPQEECTRFRIFYPAEHESVPRLIVEVMSALGAWRVWTGSAADCGSYDHRERREVHFLWPHGHPVEDLLQERLHGPDGVAPDGGCTGDVRDRMVASPDHDHVDDLEPRTRRAVTEEMSVSLVEKGGCYEVQSASGNRYEVDVIGESCTCPDWQQRSPTGGCKHLRRVDHEIKRGRVPRPDGRLPADAS